MYTFPFFQNIEEDHLQDLADSEWMHQYEKPARDVEQKDSNKHPKEFKVSKAPWDVSSAEAFPSLSSGSGGGSSSVAWGPKVRR